jgi:hypothetical protein
VSAWFIFTNIRRWSARSAESGRFCKSPTLFLAVTKILQSNVYYRHYARSPVGSKHLMVAVKILKEDAFVITAFFTDDVKGGEEIWPRK